MIDDATEIEVARLRAALAHDAEVPAGLVARLHAAIARAARRRERVAWEHRVVVACVAFILVGATAGRGAGLALTLAAAVAALGYAWLAVPREVEEPGVSDVRPPGDGR